MKGRENCSNKAKKMLRKKLRTFSTCCITNLKLHLNPQKAAFYILNNQVNPKLVVNVNMKKPSPFSKS